ncbi:MAG: FtsW/RodA/SpoVE family cell cycle protein [Coriobacteriia bacterium]|nr:FtsW/RodA/SpoVE family cell cycle protein [Coriobacteriia bacterium]
MTTGGFFDNPGINGFEVNWPKREDSPEYLRLKQEASSKSALALRKERYKSRLLEDGSDAGQTRPTGSGSAIRKAKDRNGYLTRSGTQGQPNKKDQLVTADQRPLAHKDTDKRDNSLLSVRIKETIRRSMPAQVASKIAMRMPAEASFLLVVVFILFTAGLAMCYSTTFMTQEVAYSALLKQVVFAAIGLGLSIVLLVLGRAFFTNRRNVWFVLITSFWFVSLLLVALVFVPKLGVVVNGAARWLQIGSFRFQPSELAKVALILFTAVVFDRLREDNSVVLRWVLILSYVLLQFMAYKQNDYGTVMLLHLGLLSVMLLGDRPIFSRGRGFVTSIFFLTLVPVALLFATLFDDSFRQGRWAAVFSKLDGDHILTDLGAADQLRNGILALGDGGITGLGAGLSKQKYFYLPEADNDFVFAIIGEEFGIIGAVAILVLFLLFAWLGLRIAKKAASPQGKMIAGGATSMIVGQALVNIGGIVGASPMTGKPLPFFSSGGSSMVVSLLLVACIICVAWFDTPQEMAVRRQDSLRLVRGTEHLDRNDNSWLMNNRQPAYNSPKQGKYEGWASLNRSLGNKHTG